MKNFPYEFFTTMLLIFISLLVVIIIDILTQPEPIFVRYHEYNVFHHSYYDVRTQEVSYQIDTIPIDTVLIRIK